MTPDSERRTSSSRLGDPVPAAALRTRTAAELMALVNRADADGETLLTGEPEDGALPGRYGAGGTGSARCTAPQGRRPGRTAGSG
jgi:hypothetical protein